MYTFNEFYIQDHMMEAIKRYVEDGIKPGDFLQAIICNDLKETIWRADEKNQKNLTAFVAYFYNEVPASIYGTKEKMETWINFKQEEREKRDADEKRSQDENAPGQEI